MGARTMSIPEEIIVVEGRDDTKRLIETFGPTVKTIETNGSAVNDEVLAQIVAASKRFDIIIFTDPDFQGERIRRIVSEIVPNAKHAYLTQKQADSGKIGHSLGIEHASPEDIRQALSDLITPDVSTIIEIPLSELIRLKLVAHPDSKSKRQQISEHFRLGYLNGKQLQKRLSQYGITLDQVEDVLSERS